MMHFRALFLALLVVSGAIACFGKMAPDWIVPKHVYSLEQGRTWEVALVIFPDSDATFLTSCYESNSRHDHGSPAPLNSESNVPNATDVATFFLISEFPVKFISNATSQAQKTVNLSDGRYLTSMLSNGTEVCQEPYLLQIINGGKRNTVQLWWTITETVQVDFYNRLPIFLPPGRTHSIIVNTTRFPNSNMIITETNINNKDKAADIAEIYVNKNQLATPYSHLHNCPQSNTTVNWKHEQLTQYVVVIPPTIYTSNQTEQPILPPHSHNELRLPQAFIDGEIGELEQYLLSDLQTELFGEDFQTAPNILERPYFFIWIENTSNFTLNYTIKVTQSTEEAVDLISPPKRYNSPYLYTAFFNFSKQDIIKAMEVYRTSMDSVDEVELVIDLTTYQETFLSTHPFIWLGMDYYPTHLHYLAAESRALTDDPNKPLLELFMRLHHRFNLSHIPDDAIFHLRLDGVSYSPQGFVLQPMIIRPKPIYQELPYITNFTAIDQEWVLFTYLPQPPPQSSPSALILHSKVATPTHSLWGRIGEFFSERDNLPFYRVLLSVDSGDNNKIQAFGGRNSFPTELKHDWKFEKDGNRYVLCEKMDLKHPLAFSLWNPDPQREPIDLFISFREVGACLKELQPAKPFPKTALVVLVTIGSILALILIIFSFYLCARPTKTEFLTASEEEAARIRSMGRSHRDFMNAEAAEYDKVPYLVRDSLYSSDNMNGSPFMTTNSTIHRFSVNGDDDDEFDESDGLIHRPAALGPNLAAAVFAGNERHTISDDDGIGSDTEYY